MGKNKQRWQACIALILLLCTGLESHSQKFRVEGKVVDFDTRLPLKSVSVIIRETKQGTITNDSGQFSLQPSIASFSLSFSAIGYGQVHQPVNLSENNNSLLVELKKRADEKLDEVVVNSNVNRSKVNAVEMNVVRINPELIKRSPLLLGEADIVKALVLQPGVTTVGEGAGGFNVRGGNADQNLVLVDGAPLFNTSHLLGFYSSISPDVVQDATLYKGGMPAPYGGRLSSLLNIKTKTGSNTNVEYSGGIGPMAARFNATGPLVKEKLNVTAGLRVAFPNFVLNQIPGNYGDSRAFFYDGLAKLEYAFNPGNRLSLTGYRSYDKFRFDKATTYEWETNLASLNFISSISTKLLLHLNANYSRFLSSIDDFEKNYEYRLQSSVAHKEVKTSLLYSPVEQHRIEVGVDGVFYTVSPGAQRPLTDSSNIFPATMQKEQGRELSGFITDDIDLNENVSLQVGMRYTAYNDLGPRIAYQYKDGLPLSKETIKDSTFFSKNKSIQNYRGLEPRVSVRIKLSDDFSLKASYNRGQQFLHLVSNTTTISPVDFWKLSDQYINRQVGDQYAMGLFKTYQNNQYLVSLEGYYKTTKNGVQYKDGARLLLNPYIESALLNSRSRAYGIEASLSKNSGKFTGQINYTYSKTRVQVLTKFAEESVNKGEWYPSDYDRPHNLAVVTKLSLGRGWSFNNNFVFISGRPVSFPDGNYSFNGTLVNNYSKRNMDRLPAYHRLDAGFSYISKRFPQQKKYSVWNISFYNLYLHKNVYSVFFKRNRDDIFLAREHDMLVPYKLSVVGTIIPSVSWNFYF